MTERRAEIVRLWKAGLKYADIARQLQITRSAVSAQIQLAKRERSAPLPPPPWEPAPVPATWVRTAPGKPGRPKGGWEPDTAK